LAQSTQIGGRNLKKRERRKNRGSDPREKSREEGMAVPVGLRQIVGGEVSTHSLVWGRNYPLIQTQKEGKKEKSGSKIGISRMIKREKR